MEPIRERTRLSTRGQVVIPKLIRDQAELSAGDELTVIYDGETIVLVPTDHESASTVGDAEGSAKETNTEYRTAKAGLRVQRLRTLGRLKQLQEKAVDNEVNPGELLRQSREELERRTP